MRSVDQDLKREFLNRYKLSNRRLSGDKILQILQLIITYFNVDIMHTLDQWVNYDFYILDKDDVETCDDEECPLCGCGWSLQEAVLGFAGNEKALNNFDFYEEVRLLLMNPIERLISGIKDERY